MEEVRGAGGPWTVAGDPPEASWVFGGGGGGGGGGGAGGLGWTERRGEMDTKWTDGRTGMRDRWMRLV